MTSEIIQKKPSAVLRGIDVELASDLGRAFTIDMVRVIEEIVPAAAIKEKWWIADNQWERLEHDADFLRLVNAEIERRLFNGIAVQESARVELAMVPKMLGGLTRNAMVSTANQIAAAKELRSFAEAGPKEGEMGGERVSITIITGASEANTVRVETVRPKPSTYEDDDGKTIEGHALPFDGGEF